MALAVAVLMASAFLVSAEDHKSPESFSNGLGTPAISTATANPVFKVRVYGLATDGVPVQDTPTPTLAPATAQPVLSIEGLICLYSWPCAEALSVARCESNLRPEAYNRGSGASGLFQVVPYWHSWRLRPGESLFDPVVNVRIAHELWLEQGWRPWVCQP